MQRPGRYPLTRRIDGDVIIDSVPALVALACLIPGETRFERVATLRLKESNRIEDLCAELTRAGADVTPEPDAIIVRGQSAGVAGGVTVDAHDDHRLAQALAIVATRSQHGLTITGADAVAKSYPWFYDDLKRLGADVRPGH
jgi:3-phosphoshikimate 1-carboxyvinyltransferase